MKFAASILLSVLILFSLPLHAQAQKAGTDELPPPSADAGRTGMYEAETANALYKYHVYVPASYKDTNPAGIHVFCHGQGVPGEGYNFWTWQEQFLDRFNLIGINMRYMDGDNSKDTTGKADTLWAAVAQVRADYKIIAGRGVLASFSGGGLVHSTIFMKSGRIKTGPGPDWPFCHMGLYGSNFWKSVNGGTPMTWFVGLGELEWNMGKPTLGTTQILRAQELFGAIPNGGCPDVHLKITKGKGHDISVDDVKASAAQFRRADIVFAPFLYAPDFTAAGLDRIVSAANSHSYGLADKTLAKLLARADLDPELKAQAEKIKAALDARAEQVIILFGELAADDPSLCEYYGKLFLDRLNGHPRRNDLAKAFIEARKKPAFTAAIKARDTLLKKFRSLFGTDGAVNLESADFLRSIQENAGTASLTGTMIAELLTLEKKE